MEQISRKSINNCKQCKYYKKEENWFKKLIFKPVCLFDPIKYVSFNNSIKEKYISCDEAREFCPFHK